MSAGKVASQAGHAYLGAYLRAISFGGEVSSPYFQQAASYALEEPGTKVCLEASAEKILRARDECLRLGLPHFLVVDSGCQNFYDGLPTLTALGIGPAYSHQVKPVVGKFRLHK